MGPGSRPGPRLDEGLDSRHLLDDRDRAILPPDHPLATRRSVTVAQLRGESWIVPSVSPEHPGMRMLASAWTRAGFEPDIAFETSSCEMSQALVAARGAVALVPELALHPVNPDVVVRPVTGPVTVRRVFAARRRTEHPSPAGERFLALLAEVSADHAAAASWSGRHAGGRRGDGSP